MTTKSWGRKFASWKLIPVLLALLISTPINAEEQALTKPVLLMGDSQEHERHGTFVWVAGYQVDKVAKVAARSPQLDFYTKYSMAEVVKKHVVSSNQGESNASDATFAIHLGDFLDISCASEWSRFLLVAKNDIAGGRMVLGVGNHDGFYIGNFSFDSMDRYISKAAGAEAWRDRCYAGEVMDIKHPEKNIFHKGKLVKSLVDLLRALPEAKPLKFENLCSERMVCGAMKVSDIWKVYYQYPKDMNEGNGDLSTQGKYWRSYLVSEVHLPNKDASTDVRVIVMDPSQSSGISNSSIATGLEQLYNITKIENLPKDTRLSIINGHIQNDQRELVRALLKSPCSNDGSTKHCLRILAGHHPLSDYGNDSRKWLKTLITPEKKGSVQGKPRVLNLYISAHTHTGYINKTYGVNEINVGALIEDNPHYRTFWLSQDSENHYVAHSELNVLTDNGELNAGCPIENWDYYDDFADPKGTDQFNDKYAYLEQSRLEFNQAFKRLKDAQKSGSPEAVKLWESPGLLNIHAQMLKWSKETTDAPAIQNRCVDKNRESTQTEYWKESHYQSIESVIQLLDGMKEVTQNRGKDSRERQCNGLNAYTNKGYYLAHTEAHFLSLLQDWFEKVDEKAFIIKGRENEASYRVCSARRAAEKSRVKLDPSAKKTCIQL